MFDLLIRDVHVLHVSLEGEVGVLRNYDVAIEGNHIGAVEPTGTIEPGRAREIIEAKGMVAMPGLINTHAHVPMVIFRRKAKEMTLAWCVALSGKPAQIEYLPVRDSSGNVISSEVATAIQIESADGKKRTLIVNPDGLLLNVELPDGAKLQSDEIFKVQP